MTKVRKYLPLFLLIILIFQWTVSLNQSTSTLDIYDDIGDTPIGFVDIVTVNAYQISKDMAFCVTLAEDIPISTFSTDRGVSGLVTNYTVQITLKSGKIDYSLKLMWLSRYWKAELYRDSRERIWIGSVYQNGSQVQVFFPTSLIVESVPTEVDWYVTTDYVREENGTVTASATDVCPNQGVATFTVVKMEDRGAESFNLNLSLLFMLAFPLIILIVLFMIIAKGAGWYYKGNAIKGIAETNHIRSSSKQEWIFCSNCKNHVRPDDDFCEECGHSVIRYCNRCLSQLDPDSDYCSNCGQKQNESF